MTLIERAVTDTHKEALNRAEEFTTEVVVPRADKIERSDEFPRDVVEAAGEHDTKKSSRAKYYPSDVAQFVTRRAIQIHGGDGYRKSLPLERYYRDAKILPITGGRSKSRSPPSPGRNWGANCGDTPL